MGHGDPLRVEAQVVGEDTEHGDHGVELGQHEHREESEQYDDREERRHGIPLAGRPVPGRGEVRLRHSGSPSTTFPSTPPSTASCAAATSCRGNHTVGNGVSAPSSSAAVMPRTASSWARGPMV